MWLSFDTSVISLLFVLVALIRFYFLFPKEDIVAEVQFLDDKSKLIQSVPLINHPSNNRWYVNFVASKYCKMESIVLIFNIRNIPIFLIHHPEKQKITFLPNDTFQCFVEEDAYNLAIDETINRYKKDILGIR